MLLDLQTYIATRGTVSLADISLHFHVDSPVLQPMLHKLCRKGRIQKVPSAGKCGGCTSCSAETLEFYQWIDRD